MITRNARIWADNARVRLFARRVLLPVQAANLDTAIAANLGELGCGHRRLESAARFDGVR